MLYSKKTGGFYDRKIHGTKIPSDAIEIELDLYKNLISGQELGRRIIADADGKPVLADQPEPTPDELASQIRSERAVLLTRADIEVNKREDTDEDTSAWRSYRQALRDVTKQTSFPKTVQWPELPK